MKCLQCLADLRLVDGGWRHSPEQDHWPQADFESEAKRLEASLALVEADRGNALVEVERLTRKAAALEAENARLLVRLADEDGPAEVALSRAKAERDEARVHAVWLNAKAAALRGGLEHERTCERCAADGCRLCSDCPSEFALSSDAGKGWLSPEEANQFRENYSTEVDRPTAGWVSPEQARALVARVVERCADEADLFDGTGVVGEYIRKLDLAALLAAVPG